MMERDQFIELAAGERPVVIRVATPLEMTPDPLAAYATLAGRTSSRKRTPYAFLLESAGKVDSSDPDGAFRPGPTGERHARYSFVGYDPRAVVTVETDDINVDVLHSDAALEGLVSVPNNETNKRSSTNGRTRQSPDVLDRLRRAMPDVRLAGFPDRERRFLNGGLVGFLSFDAVYDVWLSEVGRDRPQSRFPDAEFVLTTRTLVFDHREDSLSLVFTPIVRSNMNVGKLYDELVAERDRVVELLQDADAPSPGGLTVERASLTPRDEYVSAVRRAKAHVRDGDIYQGVISRKRELYGDADPLGLYAALRSENPSPYMYLLAHDDVTIVGASPETLVSVSDGRVVVNPIAGTCHRGASPVEDRRLAGEMLADEKERAEHTMLVDLARNDVRRVSRPGTVRVEEFMAILKYSHVQHIESTVVGELAPGADAFDATRSTFPAGTLAGAPKVRAMEIIDDLESEPRGIYGGGVGYYDWTGDADLAIVIRSATIDHASERSAADETDSTPRDSATGRNLDRITVRAGAGIVADSDPTAEYEETENKMESVLNAVDRITEERKLEPEVNQ